MHTAMDSHCHLAVGEKANDHHLQAMPFLEKEEERIRHLQQLDMITLASAISHVNKTNLHISRCKKNMNELHDQIDERDAE